MSVCVGVQRAVGACVSVLWLATGLSAATTSFDEFDVTTDFALADIVATDPLGYVCIREEQIDIAFHASGKGVRLPRTCLPEPCRAALSQFELASLIGRPAFPKEWDDYVSRYADHCRKEIVPFEEEEAVDEPADESVAFWTPLVTSYPASAPIRAGFPSGSSASRGQGVFGSSSLSGGGTPSFSNTPAPSKDPFFPDPDRDTDRDDEDPRRRPVPEDASPPVPAVPLPSGLVLFVTGLACLFLRRRGASAI